MKSLLGKIALVTGASRGIGRGIALGLGEAGATVYITGRTTLDQVPFWTSTDLQRKLSDFMRYDNLERTHRALGGKPPVPSARAVASIHSATWRSHCRGLYHLPCAA